MLQASVLLSERLEYEVINNDTWWAIIIIMQLSELARNIEKNLLHEQHGNKQLCVLTEGPCPFHDQQLQTAAVNYFYCPQLADLSLAYMLTTTSQ